MSWRPPGFVAPDPDLDPFRGTIAQLSGGAAFGYIAFRVFPHWRRAGGRLWWRRWDPGCELVEYREVVWRNRRDPGPPQEAGRSEGILDERAPYLSRVRAGAIAPAAIAAAPVPAVPVPAVPASVVPASVVPAPAAPDPAVPASATATPTPVATTPAAPDATGPTILTIRWLHGTERDEAWRTWGFGAADSDPAMR